VVAGLQAALRHPRRRHRSSTRSRRRQRPRWWIALLLGLIGDEFFDITVQLPDCYRLLLGAAPTG
jgi:hypothetical protein